MLDERVKFCGPFEDGDASKQATGLGLFPIKGKPPTYPLQPPRVSTSAFAVLNPRIVEVIQQPEETALRGGNTRPTTDILDFYIGHVSVRYRSGNAGSAPDETA
jgi:hypothetical protein